MLSKSSTLGENFILIPDVDWIELQITRNSPEVKSFGGLGSSSFVFRDKSEPDVNGLDEDVGAGLASSPGAPQRLPLPRILDPPRAYEDVGNPAMLSAFEGSSSVVLYSITASGNTRTSMGAATFSADALGRFNVNSNTNLWHALLTGLVPRPMDAWPSWSHNSLAQVREDGFTLMYRADDRMEARLSLTKLAREYGQRHIYEFETHREGSDGDGPETDEGGSIRRVGKDGSVIIIPALPDDRSDVMIRRTVSTAPRKPNKPPEEEPTVVMRRVKEMPVEDELTMRTWEGPPLEEIKWVTNPSKEEKDATRKKVAEANGGKDTRNIN